MDYDEVKTKTLNWCKKLYNNGTFNLQNYNDCISAFGKDSEGEIFNLGSSEIINLKDLANKLIEINGYGDFFEMNFPEDRKKIDIGDYYSDFSKITSTLGWKPSTSLNKGLKKSLEFYKNDGESYFD